MSGLSKWLLAVHSFVHASSVDLLRDTGKYKKTLINCGFLYFRGCYGWHKANRRGGGNGRSRFRQRFCRRQKQKNTLEGVCNVGCGGRIWTDDLRVMSPTSYQAAPPRVTVLLHFVKFDWLRGPDLNRRPSGYEPDELPGCSTPRHRIAFTSSNLIGCGGRIWTDDLRVMSPTSYQAAPPRVTVLLYFIKF